MSGNQLASRDSKLGLEVSSTHEVNLMAGHSLTLTSAEILMTADDSIDLVADSIRMESSWNENISFQTDGGTVLTDGLAISGQTIHGSATRVPVVIESANDLLLVAPRDGGSVRMEGGSVSIAATTELKIESQGEVSIKTGWNEQLKFDANGGEMLIDNGIAFAGTQISALDQKFGLDVSSPSNLQFEGGDGHQLMLSAPRVSFDADDISIKSDQIALNTEWNGKIAMDSRGGRIQVGALDVTGASLTSESSKYGLTVDSKEHVNLHSERTLFVSGEEISLSADATARFSASEFMISSDWNKQVALDSTGGNIQLDGFSLSGTHMAILD